MRPPMSRLAAPMHLNGVEQEPDSYDHDARGNADHEYGERLGERPHPQRRDNVLTAKYNTETHTTHQHAEHHRHKAPGKEQPRERHAPRQHQAGDEDNGALSDVAEHETENQ